MNYGKLVGITVFLIILYGLLLISDENALTAAPHLIILERLGMYGILSLAAGLVIIIGGIDLSIGALVALLLTVFGLLVTQFGWGLLPAFLAMLALGAGVGFLNGLIVTKLKVQPFMVTLCGLFIFRSLARWLSGDSKIDGVEDKVLHVSQFFNGSWLGLPVYLYVLIFLVILTTVFLHFSVHGRYLFAIGSNEKAARFAGIPTDRYKILAFMLCSTLTVIYSFLYLMKTTSITPSETGLNDELYAIAGAVLGGCALRGGEGTIYGMVVGTLIIQLLRILTRFWGIPSSAEGMMIGVILLLGAVMDELLRRRRGLRT